MCRILLAFILLTFSIINIGFVYAGGIISKINMDGKFISISSSDSVNKLETLIKKKITNQEDTQKPSWSEIKKIGEEYGLFKIGGLNFGLKMQDGTVGYWHDQKLSKTECQIQLLARKIVLDAANNQKVVIGDQGKLSFVAERLINEIVERMAKDR